MKRSSAYGEQRQLTASVPVDDYLGGNPTFEDVGAYGLVKCTLADGRWGGGLNKQHAYANAHRKPIRRGLKQAA
jgi:hypothetical protein